MDAEIGRSETLSDDVMDMYNHNVNEIEEVALESEQKYLKQPLKRESAAM